MEARNVASCETNGNIMKWHINSWIIANIGVAELNCFRIEAECLISVSEGMSNIDFILFSF